MVRLLFKSPPQRHLLMGVIHSGISPSSKIITCAFHNSRAATVTGSPPDSPHYNVIIVGGGVVGSTLALNLSNKIPSLKIALLHGDQSPPTRAGLGSTPMNPRAYALSPTSLNILGLDIVQQLQQMGRVASYDKIQVWESDGPSVLTFSAKDIDPIVSSYNFDDPQLIQLLDNTLGAVVEDEVLIAFLWDKLRKRSNVSLLCPCKIHHVQPNHTNPRVNFSYLDSVSRHDIHEHTTQTVQSATTDLLIAADGANSFVRRYVGSFPIISLSYGRRAITCTVLMNQSLNRIAFQRFQPNGPIALLPIQGIPTKTGHYYANIVWSTTPDEARTLNSLTDAEFTNELNQILQMGPTTTPTLYSPFSTPFAKAAYGLDRILQSLNTGLTMSNWTERPESSFIVPPIINQVVGPRLDFDLNLMQATKYVSGRIILVGDAAHSVHPMAGTNFFIHDKSGYQIYLSHSLFSIYM